MDTQKRGRTRRAKEPYHGPKVSHRILVQRGYLKVDCRFTKHNADGTETVTEDKGGWVPDWDHGRLFFAFAETDHGIQGCGWSQNDAVESLKRDFPQVEVTDVVQDR